MSGTPPQSPSKVLSNVDHSEMSEHPLKDDGTSIVEADPDESLHIGTDALADNLDYEAEELDEQEEITNGGKSSPLNLKDNSFQEFDSYGTDVKDDVQSSFDGSRNSFEDSFSETVAAKIGNGDEVEENIADEGQISNKPSYISNANVGTTNDTAVDTTLVTNDGNNDTDAKENSASKADEEIKSKSIENISNEELEEGEVSDEDEEARKERLKPQPVCRFYSKGACTWGASCRFIHPGVMDTGR